MQRLVLFGYIKISCLCKSFVCDGVRKDSAPRKCPVSFPRIAVSVGFPMRHTKLFKIGNSCPWSFPLFSDIHAYSAAKPSVPVVYCALHIRNCLVVEPTLHRIDADCLALFRIYPEFQFLFKVSGAGFKQSFGCSFAFRQKYNIVRIANHLLLIYLLHLRRKARAVSDFVFLANSSTSRRLICSFFRQTEVLPIAVLLNHYIRLPSDSASRQTPLPSAAPTAKSVADFHRRAVAHAGRTKKQADEVLHSLACSDD